MIDGITAANDLGLTHAVPGQVVVHTDGRLRPIQLGQMTLKFKLTAPSRLYWAGRPAMRVIQALHWLRDGLKQASSPDQEMAMKKLVRLLQATEHGNLITRFATGAACPARVDASLGSRPAGALGNAPCRGLTYLRHRRTDIGTFVCDDLESVDSTT